ncbi:MAG: hypothetical protein QOK38_2512 [Acidobacteriaceae bacterium]|jgi:hypothetical protein|nr:hypothetical protein [Acidobacteriaceae bacterium]
MSEAGFLRVEDVLYRRNFFLKTSKEFRGGLIGFLRWPLALLRPVDRWLSATRLYQRM